MLFDPRNHNNPPESIILVILSLKPRLNTKEIYDLYLSKTSEKITIQGFYKVIRQMLKNRILVKENGLLSLDSYWINNLLIFTDRVKQIYLQTSVTQANILLEPGESRNFEFENVVTMDNFWAHSLNVVRNFYNKEKHDDKNAYSRNYFSVFQLARTNSESTIIESFEASKMQWYMVSGSNAFLNKLVPKLIENPNYHNSLYNFENYAQKKSASGQEVIKNYWVTVIGDFIFEARLPKYIFDLIGEIYANVQNIAEFNAEKINALFQEPGKSFLTISRDAKKATAIREEIKNLINK